MQLSMLSKAQIGRIHDASLSLLLAPGVRIPHADMRRRFREAGADVDDDAALVKIPEHLVAWALEQAGKTFTLYGRDRARQARYGVGERNYNSVAGEASWVEESGGSEAACSEAADTQRRYARLADVATATRLADALPHINLVGAMADPADVPPPYRCVAVAVEQLKHTTKPIQFWWHDRASARYVVEVLAAVAGSEEAAAQYPLTYPFLEPISPLKFPHDGIDLLYETARLNLPVPIGPMAQVGATAPGTLAGTLAQENAEILAGICITQLIKPGLPVCYGGIPHAFDMRTTQLIFAGPEQALMAVAMTEIGKHYGLPVYINVGLTDSKLPDAQAGLEAGMTLLCGVLAGADIFGHLGIAGVDQATSLSMLVMQHEIIGYIERIMQGFAITDETLGLDVVREVGHDGTFLDTMHTFHHFRQELWFPQLLDRHYWANWMEEGATSMHERCGARVARLLREHVPTPPAPEMQRELDLILDAARRHLG